MKKNATKIAVSAAVVASAFVATAPNQADAATNVDQLVQDAQNAGTVLKWAISVEGSGDGVTQPWADYNNAKAAIAKAEAAIKGLSFSDKLKYEARLVDVKLQVSRAAAYIDAITSSKKINDLTASLNAAVATNNIDTVEAAYHTATAEFRKQTVLLDRVYGKSTRDAIRTAVKGPIEKLVAELKNDVTVNMLADAAAVDVAAGRYESASAKLADAQAILDANVLKWETTLQKNVNDVVASITPMVTSVSAINAKQLVVKFNSALEGENATLTNDATDVANYKLGTGAVFASPTSSVLSSDKKSVTLTFAADVEGENQVVVIEPVATTKKDKDGAVVSTEKYSTILTYTDTVAPTVVSTSYSNDVVTVQFSEAIGTKPTVVRVNGVPVVAGDISINASDSTKVDIAYAGLTAGTTANLYVAGAKDTSVAANEIALYNGTVIAPSADTGKPQITSVQVTGQNTAKVTLSEDIAAATIVAKLQKGASITPVTLSEDLTDTTGKTYTLSVDLNGATDGDGIFTGASSSETFSLLVAAEAMADATGNKNAEFITNLTFVKDIKAPALVKSEATTNNLEFGFTFDEALTVVGTETNIIVKNQDGVKINVDAATDLKANSDDKVYLVDITNGAVAIAAGTYTVTLPSGYFKDQFGNATSAITSTFTVGSATNADTTKPVAAVTNVAAVKNVFEVEFFNGAGGLEEVTSSALNLNNYKLDGKALPTGTQIYFTSTAKNTVNIELPANSINIGDQAAGAGAILTVANVQDKAGNVLNLSNHSVTVTDNIAATISNLQVVGTDVYVTFTENVTIAADVDANTVFDVKVNNAEVAAGVITLVNGNTKQIKFTLDAPATPTVTVKAAQTALKDANGVLVK